MTNPLQELASKIAKLEDQIKWLLNQEPSKIVTPLNHVRIIDDTTPRVAAYNQNYQITGTGGLPSRITAVFWNLFVVGNATPTAITIVVANPDSGLSPVRVATTLATAGNALTSSGFNRIGGSAGSFPGMLTVNLTSGSISRLVLDITGYQI